MTQIKLEKKQFKFIHNQKQYVLNTSIKISLLKCYFDNKGKLSDKEIAKMCITKGNNINHIINTLNKNQLLFILNAYMKNSGIKYIRIKSYNEFIKFLDLYWDVQCDKIKTSIDKIKIINTQSFQVIRENMNYVTNEIGKLTLNVQNNLLDCTKTMVNFSNYLEPFHINIQNMMAQINESITNAIKNLDFKGIKNTFEGCKLLLINLGYPFINIEINEMKYIYDHKDDENINEIIESIILNNYKDEEVIKMLEKWKTYDFIKKRIHILEDVIYAYNYGKYTLSIPVLFSQMEGLIADFFDHKKAMSGGQYKEYIEKILLKDKKEEEYIDEITKSYFFNNILERFAHGDEIPKLSRHAIIHGGDVNYGTKINNLNIIITFDTIIDYMYKINENKVE